MSRRTLLLTGAFVVALTGVATAAGVVVDADEMTLVRVPGAVPVKTCTITSTGDAHVDETLPDDTFGTGTTVDVEAGPADRWALVRFDIAACAIPPGADVRSAALRMVLVTAPAEDRSWKVRRVVDPWTEAAVTWNTQPGLAAASTDIVSTGTAPGTALSWNVEPDVADVVAGSVADRGWRIVDVDEAPPAPVGGSLAAREHADPASRPSLTITWFD